MARKKRRNRSESESEAESEVSEEVSDAEPVRGTKAKAKGAAKRRKVRSIAGLHLCRAACRSSFAEVKPPALALMMSAGADCSKV